MSDLKQQAEDARKLQPSLAEHCDLLAASRLTKPLLSPCDRSKIAPQLFKGLGGQCALKLSGSASEIRLVNPLLDLAT
jgi:hypothetical protein